MSDKILIISTVAINVFVVLFLFELRSPSKKTYFSKKHVLILNEDWLQQFEIPDSTFEGNLTAVSIEPFHLEINGKDFSSEKGESGTYEISMNVEGRVVLKNREVFPIKVTVSSEKEFKIEIKDRDRIFNLLICGLVILLLFALSIASLSLV